MPKIDVTFNKKHFSSRTVYGFKLMVSSLTLIFPKERHLGEEEKQKQSCHQADNRKKRGGFLCH